MTKKEWAALVAAMAYAYPRSEFDEEWIGAWYPTVAHIPIEAAWAGLELWKASGRPFPPTGGELLQMVGKLSGGTPDFDEVWGEIVDQVRKTGSWGTPVWSSEQVAKIVSRFGWKTICQTETSDLGTLRAQMRRMWESMSERKQVSDFAQVRGLPDPETRPKLEELVARTAEKLRIGTGEKLPL